MGLRPIGMLVGVACLLGHPSAWSASPAIVAEAPIVAIWRIQAFDFHYRGGNGTYHSCSSLYDKIRGVMEAIGAGEVRVNIACTRNAFVNSTYARVATAMPAPASEENIRAATTFTTEQHMIAKMNGIDLPTPNTMQRFPAEWRTITVESVPGLRFGPEDCDLLQGLQRQILPHLPAVRIVRKRFSCGDSHMRATQPVLVVEALMRSA